jgi:hypothetical protein
MTDPARDPLAAAWEAFYADLRSGPDPMAVTIARHRPLIEAAIRDTIYAEDTAEYERPLRRDTPAPTPDTEPGAWADITDTSLPSTANETVRIDKTLEAR